MGRHAELIPHPHHALSPDQRSALAHGISSEILTQRARAATALHPLCLSMRSLAHGKERLGWVPVLRPGRTRTDKQELHRRLQAE